MGPFTSRILIGSDNLVGFESPSDPMDRINLPNISARVMHPTAQNRMQICEHLFDVARDVPVSHA